MFSLCQSDPCWVNPPAYLTYLNFSDGLKPLSWVQTASFGHSQKIVLEPERAFDFYNKEQKSPDPKAKP